MQLDLLKARENLRDKLLNNAEIVIKEVQKENLNGLTEIGLFGSVAKDKFTCKSDTDIYLLFEKNIPDRTLKGRLRSIAEENNCDIVFMTENYFEEKLLLARNILESRIILWRNETNDSK